MLVRKPQANELEQVYKMGFATWNEGESEQDYLRTCRNSTMYQAGSWFVGEHQRTIVASLIVYDHGFKLPDNSVGIGSVATHHNHRHKGYASSLVSEVVSRYRAQGKRGVYLFSDIDPTFYKRLGFKPITAKQRYEDTVSMVNVFGANDDLYGHAPEYF